MKDAERVTYGMWEKVHGLFWQGKPEEAKRELASYGEKCYRAGVKELESGLIALCQNGGQSWAWIEEAATSLLEAQNEQ